MVLYISRKYHQSGLCNAAVMADKPPPGQELAPKDASLFRSVIKFYEGKHYKKGIKAADQVIIRHAPSTAATVHGRAASGVKHSTWAGAHWRLGDEQLQLRPVTARDWRRALPWVGVNSSDSAALRASAILHRRRAHESIGQ